MINVHLLVAGQIVVQLEGCWGKTTSLYISADETTKTKPGSWWNCDNPSCNPKVPLLPVSLLFLMFIHLISSNKILSWALNTMNGMVILIWNYGNAGRGCLARHYRREHVYTMGLFMLHVSKTNARSVWLEDLWKQFCLVGRNRPHPSFWPCWSYNTCHRTLLYKVAVWHRGAFHDCQTEFDV